MWDFRLLLLGLLACGVHEEATDRANLSTAALREGPSGPDDIVVAQVNDVPIWRSCVAHIGGDVKQALNECIGFELLSQAAAGRTADPRQTRAGKAILANAMMDIYDQRITAATHLPASTVERVIKDERQLHPRNFAHPEIRYSYYVRVRVPKLAVPGGPEDSAAKALADRIFGVLSKRRGWFGREFLEAGIAAAGTDHGLTVDAPSSIAYGSRYGSLVESYASAMFAIPEVGSISPPTKVILADRGRNATDYNGWDIILLADVMPENTISEAQTAESVFPAARRAYFPEWMKHEIAVPWKKLEVTVDDSEAP